MGAFRALLFAILIVATPFCASAQFGGMPGLPGGTPGGAPGVGGFGAPPAPPPACQQLLALRDEAQKHSLAISKANERKASVQEACRLFKSYLSAELKFMQGIEEHGRTCGVSPDVLHQVKDSHSRATQIAKQVCEAAAQGPRLGGPSLYDALRGDLGDQVPRERGDFWMPGDLQRMMGPR